MSNPNTHQPGPMGMPNPDFNYEPTNVDHLFPDAPDEKDVFLEVYIRNRDMGVQSVRNRHWQIGWLVGNTRSKVPVFRLLRVTAEFADRQGRRNNYLTNWGPLTKAEGEFSMMNVVRVHLGRLSAQKRLALEQIAATEPIVFNNPNWNCQDWIVSVLRRAINQFIFSSEQVAAAIERACQIPPPNE